MKRRVILLGPPGSGKGTVAAQLRKDFGYSHISTGQMLRDEVAAGSALGQRAQSFLERGELVPDEIVLDLVQRWMSAVPPESGFISDGFPRTLGQAKALDEWAKDRQIGAEAVLLLDCPVDEIVSRISGRRVCPKCGTGYHVQHLPPKVDGECDECRTKLVQRRDDSEEVVRRRLTVYDRETEPLVSYYWQLGRLTVVDASSEFPKLYTVVKALLA